MCFKSSGKTAVHILLTLIFEEGKIVMFAYLNVLKVPKAWSFHFLLFRCPENFYIEPPRTQTVGFLHWDTVLPEICWEKEGEEVWKEHRLYSRFQFANNTPSQVRENLQIYKVKIQIVHKVVCCKFKFYWNDSQKKLFKLAGQITWNQEEKFAFPSANLKDELNLKYHTKYFPSRPYISVCLCVFYVFVFVVFLDYISLQKASGSCCANAKARSGKSPVL